MSWSSIEKAPLYKDNVRKDYPEGLWYKCDECGEIIFKKDFEDNQYVCVKCQHHYTIPPEERIRRFLDTDTFEEYDVNLESDDPLEFSDSQTYVDRLRKSQKKTKRLDAIICGRGLLYGRPVELGVFDFSFMGGSMGSVVGEKLARLFQRSIDTKTCAIVFSSSGGARMQEGILSLMQMAKTCTMIAKLKKNKIPFISVLTHPTTGGVAASFSMLGDVNIGEPKALIGFAGPRVIQQTIGQELPEGFQRSEFLIEHGMLDMICHRDALRVKIAQILNILSSSKYKQEELNFGSST